MGRPERLIRLMAHLVEAGQITTAQAARSCGEEVGKRVVLQDLALIGEHWSRCRHVEDGRASRWVIDPTAKADARELLDRLALDIGREHMRFLDDTRLSHPARAVARQTTWRAEGLDQKIYFHHEPARSYDVHTEELSDVLDALFQDLQLTVRYRRGDGSERTLERQTVLSLVVYRRAVFALMVGQGESPKVPPCVAVDRMVETTVHNEPAARPPGWDPRAYYRDAFGVVLDRPPERVVLRFTARVAAYVYAREWHPSEEKIGLPDGGVELRMRVAGRELVRWVLEWGPQIEVVAPAWLRNDVVAELRASLARYES